MRKEVGWKWYHSIGLPLSYSRWDFQTNRYRPHPLRGLKRLSETCFCHLKSIIVCKWRHSVGLRHTFHIVHLIQTTLLTSSPIFEKTVIIGFPSSIFSNNAIVASDIWSVGKEPTAMFEFTTWHASFPDFFTSLRSFTDIGKQLLISNNRNRVRWEV